MSHEQSNEVFDYRTIRRFVGILALGLPILLVVIALCMGFDIVPSISEFFYTPAREVLVGTIGAISIFLYCYNGHPRDAQKAKTDWREKYVTDRVLSLVAATGALGVAFFPVKSDLSMWTFPDAMFVQILGDTCASHLHKASALSFFAALAWFCLDNFRRAPANKVMSDYRLKENKLYKACGIIILICTLGLVVLGVASIFFTSMKAEADEMLIILVLETIALIAFALAWIVKGKTKSWLTEKLGLV